MKIAFAVAAAVMAMLLTPGPADAAPKFEHYVALGDSYAAVADHTSLVGTPGCFRSSKSYPFQVAARLGITDVVDVACGDARAEHMTAPQQLQPVGTNAAQFDSLRPDTDLVTVSIGGNDGLVATLQSCIPTSLAGGSCEQALGPAAAELQTNVSAKVGAVIDGIKARSPAATIVYVGYPLLFPAGPCATLPVSPVNSAYLHTFEAAFNGVLAATARAHGAIAVDPSNVTGHDACQPPDVRYVEPLVPSVITSPFHPNPAGAAFVGGLVADAIRAA